MTKLKRLGIQLLLYQISNLGSQLLLFFLLSITAYFLNPEVFWEVNLVKVTGLLGVPIVSFNFIVPVLKCWRKSEVPRKGLNAGLTDSYALFLIMIVGVTILEWLPFHTYYTYFILLLFFQRIFSTIHGFTQWIRARHEIRENSHGFMSNYLKEVVQ
ncbi:hypothetical protein RAK27_02070 [Carnobacterium maltaromaticum]|uniref:Uncharacterized protein n=1 Tax=Carnobacterium maltaromaticum TaxID=2751 RepID=A0AAW9JPP8_CARML|nr:hypothetical protein [Carnobacterium maltaromaticum]MDZ5757443.1 hypothetical protein [Carnobacterium maltaromaticum]